MIHLVIVRNPFDLKKRDLREKKYREGAPIRAYFRERGDWHYSINGAIVGRRTVPKDGDYVVIVPRVKGKVFGLILSVGLSILTAGIASGTILGGLSMGWRMVTAIAVGMIGGAIISRLNAPHVDMSNTETKAQSPTYGWGGSATLTGQGHPLAITYGAMKSSGVLLSRHIVSDGARQYLHLLYCAGEGELDDIRDLRINENPATNYKDVQIDIRHGTNDQAIIPNFADNYADQPLNYELSYAWATHEVQGNLCTGLELTVALPNGLYYSNDEGGMSSTWLTLEAECRIVDSDDDWMRLPLYNATGMDAFVSRKDGQWVRSLSGAPIGGGYGGSISDATNRGIYRVYRFENLPAGRYEVRMRCSDKGGSTVRYVNRVYWSQLTQIVYDDFTHPGKALIGIRALATEQLSGNDPSVSWVQERAKVYVLNPYSKKYEEKRADNPAWACYDILHQCRKIEGRYIVRGEPAERISYDMFRAWAEQCESKGYTFNYIYDKATQIWDALRYPEAVGRGKVVMQGTRFTCIYDYAAEPTQLFTVGNIKQDSFKEEFQGTQGRANAVEISFMNKAKNYERDVLPVFSDDYDASETFATPTQIELMGCTDLKQAYAHGKHALRANKYELRTCTFEAFVDAIACTLGDVILLQHDVTDWGSGGRVIACEGDTVTLDRNVTMAEGKTYRLMVRDSKTDRLDTYDVVSVDGAVVTLAAPADIAPDDLYTYGEATKEAKPFRVLAITKGMTEQTRKITCMEYYPELYADDNTDVPIIDYTTQSDALKVDSLLLDAATKALPDGTTLYDISVSWRLPRGRVAKQIKVEYKRTEEQEYTTLGVYDGNATGCLMTSVDANASYTVRVTCYNDLGLAGSAVTQTVYTAPKNAPPSQVQGFTVEQDKGNSSILHLTWKANPEADVLGYRLADDAGTVLVDLIGGTSYMQFVSVTGRYGFAIKAVNRSGILSETPATASITAEVMAGSIAAPDMPHSGEVQMDKGLTRVAWEAVTNTYIDYYEVRTNSNVGQLAGRLAKTADIRTVVTLKERTGTVYIYGHNPKKGYGEPLALRYDFPAPTAPVLQIKETLQGFTIAINDRPANALGTRVFISSTKDGGNTEIMETTGTLVSYAAQPDYYDVSACFFDSFGEGVPSVSREIIVLGKIAKGYLESLDIAEQDLNALLAKRLQDMQATGEAAKESATSIVAKLSSNPQDSGYSAITQLYNGLQLKVNQGDVVSAINIAPGGVRIDGRLLHVTGDTLFDGNIIASRMLQAGAVTADKLSVDSLSAVSARIGKLRTKDTGARTEISDNLIEVFDADNKARVRIGVFE